MKNFFRIFLATIAVIFLLLVSFYSLLPQGKTEKNILNVWNKIGNLYSNSSTEERASVLKEAPLDINSLPFEDNESLYEDDQPDSLVTMYLTVRKGTVSNNTNHTWNEVNNSFKFSMETQQQTVVDKVEAILQVGDEFGPLPGEIGYGDEVPNSIVSVRGNTSSNSPQKSFKIELHGKGIGWRDQKTIDLNKHVFETTRVINKLSFDLLKDIPNMVSLRTQFVHLYVKDETINPPETAFMDYGLFTQVEQPNERFLKNHLLDRYGQLYKATFFEFERYPDQIHLADDPAYNESEFSKILEIKGNKDHTKLIQMLDDLNNYDIPIKQTFEKYFNADNYFTWMAFNILVGNVDTNTQNFYLYSPQNGDKWYFIPWDYDDSFTRQVEEAKNYTDPWMEGISTYWGTVLGRRVLMEPQYRQMLDQKINGLRVILTPEKIKGLLDLYYPISYNFVTKMPDMARMNKTNDEYNLRFTQIPNEPQINYQLYQDSLTKPMPFFLGIPQKAGDQIEFNWEDSFDLDGQEITYKFTLASDWDFKNILSEKTLTGKTWVKIPLMETGVYFWRVTATNEDGKEQLPFDRFTDADGKNHYGLKPVYVTPNGKVVESQSEN